MNNLSNLAALQPLSNDQVKARALAAFSNKPSPDRSDRYAMVHTPDVIAGMRAQGYLPTAAGADKPTRRDPRFVRHMVRFTHEKALDPSAARVGNVVPQVLFWNSHNGRTMARMSIGFYRFVCANGLVVGTQVNEYAFRHAGAVKTELLQALELADETARYGLERVQRFEGVKMKRAQIINFAQAAARLRFGASAEGYDPEAIANPAREEDSENNLWSVFNRVQERLMLGGLGGTSANGRRVLSRPITGITTDLAFNRGLWQIAEDFADAA
jgi:hypothetical protein